MFQFILVLHCYKTRSIFDSNTSHVPIYQIEGGLRKLEERFKYISCSNLSIQLHTIAAHFDGFKYISCSNLSTIPTITLINFINSNTSHVPIYPNGNGVKSTSSRIQIHLMFQFIRLSLVQIDWKFNSNTSHVPIYLFHAVSL